MSLANREIWFMTAASVFLLMPESALSAQQPSFIPHRVPLSYSLTTGPDGAIWFPFQQYYQPELYLEAVGRVAIDGTYTAYPALGCGATTSTVPSITTGPDGALWFACYGYIGRITTSGALSYFPVPQDDHVAMTAGPDGAIWFTEFYAGAIGRITTDGIFTEYPIGFDSYLNGITSGSDGAVWFTEGFAGNIGRITTSGVITEFPLPDGQLSTPVGIVNGPDGALWFAENGVSKIGRITTGGAITSFSTPTSNSGPYSITASSNHLLWFTEQIALKIASITRNGLIEEYPIDEIPGIPYGITTAAEGTPWFSSSALGQTVFPTAELSLSPNSGSPGLQTTITGSGFAPEEIVDVYLDSIGSHPVASAQADSTGSFTLSTEIPSSPLGYNTDAAMGKASGSVGVAPFTVTPRITINPSNGEPGSVATVEGFGFTNRGGVYLNWFKPNVSLGQATAGNNGSFSLKITVPVSATAGEHVVGALDVTSQTPTTTHFDVE